MNVSTCTKTYFFQNGFLQGYGSAINPIPVTSDYGKRKRPNNPSEVQFHTGIDFGVPVGTVIKAPVDGKIIKCAVQKKGAGLYIVEEYENAGGEKFYIYFMHLSQSDYKDGTKAVGSIVKAGDVIGKTGGAKGNEFSDTSTGPHLHLEIRKDSIAKSNHIDPKHFFLGMNYMKYKKTGLPIDNTSYMTEFGASKDPVFCSEYLKSYTPVEVGVTEVLEVTIPDETEFSEKKGKKVNKQVTERLALGIWQITKLLIDSEVQGKQVCDSSISVQTGSLKNYFDKVCQRPFVEFFGDTFGNQFYWITRRPPFDANGFSRMYNTMTNISESQILSKNLQFDASGAYSWYQLIPTGDVLGIGEQTFLVPAVFFPEYASVWGSKPMSIQSNYYNYVYSGVYNLSKEQNKSNANRIAQNIVKDFRYIIESNAYLPFSRTGTVTLAGNFTIKRGTMVKFDNNEIFHVDAVTHSYNVNPSSVNRTTTLQLSHGIYDDFRTWKERDEFLAPGMYDEQSVSYFNLIDFGNYKIEDITTDNYQEIISKWKVNKDAFTFFLRRMHIINIGNNG